MSKSKLQGNEIIYVDGKWIFSDTSELIEQSRPCGFCGKHAIREGNEAYDACIGKVGGLMNACCGHGDSSEAYAQFHDGSELRGDDAVKYFSIRI